MDVEELKVQRRLLQQQLGLVDRRVENAAVLLNRKRAAKPLPAGVETFAEHKKGEQQMVSKSVGHVPDMISAPSPVALGGRIEQIRNRALVHRADQTERRRVRDSKVILPAPSKAGAYRKQTVQPTMFPTRYSRGELPCAIEHRASGVGARDQSRHSVFLSAQPPRACRQRAVMGVSAAQPRLRALLAHLFRWGSLHGRSVQIHGAPGAKSRAAKQRSFSSLAALTRCPGSARIARGIARLPRAHLALHSEPDLAVETGAHDEECGHRACGTALHPGAGDVQLRRGRGAWAVQGGGLRARELPPD